MHKYLLEVDKISGGKHRFIVMSEDKEQALNIGKCYVYNETSNPFYKYTVRIVKKLDRVFSVKEIKE